MSALVIKTGMSDEQRIARAYAAPGTLVLGGVQTVADLHKAVPADCNAIISFGLCGGLAPEPQIGQVFIADAVVTPLGEFEADVAWRERLFAKTHSYERHWWSSGVFNTADTPVDRAALFKRTGCWIIDDETAFVAQFAKERGLAFQALRSVSDGASDTVPPAARNALDSNGTLNIEEVFASAVSDPAQLADLIRLGEQYYRSLAALRTAALQVGPTFQWIE